MADPPFSLFDLTVIGVIVLSALLSLVRGATREALTIGAWLAAAAVAYHAFSAVLAVASRTIQTEWLAIAGAGVVSFVLPLIVFKLVGSWLADRVRGSALGPADKVLGVGFGVIRGLFLVSAVYLGLTTALAENERPDWLRSGRLVPYVQQGADWLAGFLPGSRPGGDVKATRGPHPGQARG